MDQRYESLYEYQGAPGQVTERGTSDYDADGEVDARFAITSDYDTHARAARAIAVEFFDSDKVLSGLLRQVGLE